MLRYENDLWWSKSQFWWDQKKRLFRDRSFMGKFYTLYIRFTAEWDKKVIL